MYRTPLVLSILVLARAASAAPEGAPDALSASFGASASPDGGFLSTVSVCNDQQPQTSWLARFTWVRCTGFQIGRDPEERAQGDLVFATGASFTMTPWLQVRGLATISASSLFEVPIHSLVWAIDDTDHSGEEYVPWTATQLSGSVALRANLDWGFVELGGSYHHHVSGSALDWSQPSGMYIGISVGLAGAMRVDPPLPPQTPEPEVPLLPDGPTTI